ncbi:MAG: DUF2953 domain-containing protein [Oscillospiraceae bacterium]|nr:DUF2953 domain-containing protein [Oscillospiraceae bacterium]
MSAFVIALLVLLSLVLFVMLVLSFPLSFCVRYVGEELYVDLKFLFYKKRLMPQDKKEKKSGQKKEQKEDNPKKDKKPKEAFFDTVERFTELLSAGGSIGRLALSLHKASLDFKVKVGGEDAADAAIQSGRMSAYLHTAAAVLANLVNIKKRSITVSPDYSSKDSEYDLYARFWSHPISYVFNIHKILPLLIRIADALPPKDNEKGEKKQ